MSDQSGENSNIPEGVASILEELYLFVDVVARATHPGEVLLMTQGLEDTLEAFIYEAMPNADNKLYQKLFKGYGPLSSFAAKIDFAFAFGIITDEESASLRAIKDVRVGFAHPRDRVHLGHADLAPRVAKLPHSPGADASPWEAFVTEFMWCSNQFRKKRGLELLAFPDESE
jgi:hypothetical protein